GLVHACRYCGLIEESIAAHEEARRLDPNVPTSVEQSVLMTGDFERLLTIRTSRGIVGGDEIIRIVGLGMADRRAEARGALIAVPVENQLAAFRTWKEFLLAWLERRPEEMR